eukprot:6905117-Pyramimonas_sp.AAC.1
MVLGGFWLFRGLLGELFGHVEPSWSGLGTSWNIVGTILTHLGALSESSEAVPPPRGPKCGQNQCQISDFGILAEASWNVLGASGWPLGAFW